MLLTKVSRYFSWNHFEELYKLLSLYINYKSRKYYYRTFDCFVYYLDQKSSSNNLMKENGLTKEKKIGKKVKENLLEI